MSSEAASVAVLGAGITGLSCAHALHAAGRRVLVLDKGRGVGGRTSTRRFEADPARGWDHGASSFFAEDERFFPVVRDWWQAGVVGLWPLAASEGEVDPLEFLDEGLPSSWVGTPSMSAIAQHLAQELEVEVDQRVVALERGTEGWKLRAESREGMPRDFGPFRNVVLTAPPAQSRALLESVAPSLAQRLLDPWVFPSWALMAVTERVENPVPIRRVGPGHLADGVSALICEDTKPGRLPHPRGTRWTLQTTAEWTRLTLDMERSLVQSELEGLLEESLGMPALESQAHRWLYARIHRPLGVDCLTSEDGIILAGDFCRGDGIESAWLSGQAAAAECLLRN